MRNTQHFAGNPPVESHAYRDVGIHAEVSTLGEDHLNPVIAKLAVIMIESVEGLESLDAIATVPGIGALLLGAGSDLSRSMGVAANSPEVEAAFQQVLKACKAHKVACGITAGNANDIVRRVKEGWSIIRSTVPAITQARTQLGDR